MNILPHRLREQKTRYVAYSSKATEMNVGIAECLEALPGGGGTGSLAKMQDILKQSMYHGIYKKETKSWTH